MAVDDINTVCATECGGRFLLFESYYQQERFDDIKRLVRNTADINKPNFRGRRALWILASVGIRTDIIALAIEKGAEIEHKDSITDSTALLIAVHRRRRETVSFLLSKGADPCSSSDCFYFPLYMAVWYSDCEIASLLLKNNANPNQKTRENQTALHMAVRHGHIEMIELLIEYDADPMIFSHKWSPMRMAELLLRRDDIVNILKRNSVQSIIQPLSNLKLESSRELADD